MGFMSVDQDRTMVVRVKRIFRYIYLRLVRVADDPVHVALGFALGVFIGVFPTFGLGIPVALFLAALFRWNKAAALLGTLLVNPLTTPFFWSLSGAVGALMLRTDTKSVLRSFRGGEGLKSLSEGALIYLAGNTVVALLSAAIAYLLAVRAVRFYRREKEKRRKPGNVGE
jgi:uncharacterized protein (DUF2062 family)